MKTNNAITTVMKKALGLLIILFIAQSFQVSYSQVSIAPTSLFFDNQNRFGSLAISNGGNQAQEVSISIEFGFPTSEDGNIVISRDSALALEKSMADWIKVFPQSFTLQGQQRQVVRFVLRAPQDVDPGGYWARVKVASNPVSPPIESVGENQVGAQINLVVEQVIAAHYRTPDATTSVKINDVHFQQRDDENQNSILGIEMEQMGNAPFVGSISFSISDPSGKTVYQTSTNNSVYTTITRSFQINTSDWEPGTYSVSGTITSQRRDINADKLLQITPVNFSRQITIE